MHKTKIINHRQFSNLLSEGISKKNNKANNICNEEHSELITILNEMLITECDIHIDYADLIGLIQKSDFIRYGIFFGIESAIQNILEMDETATELIIYIKVPLHFSLETLKNMCEKLELAIGEGINILFQLEESSDLQSGEAWIYLLYGAQATDN